MTKIQKSFFLILFLSFFSWTAGSQTANIDFELTPVGAYTTSNAVSGWTVSSQTVTSCVLNTNWLPGSPEFSIVSTPILSFPVVGNIPQSPLGGNNIAVLNSTLSNQSSTKLSRDITVTSTTSLIYIAFGGVMQNGHVNCCDQAGFKIQLKNSSGILLPCLTTSITPGPGCQTAGITYSVSGINYWSNWQLRYIDLSPFINTTITLEIISNDCKFGDHYGCSFIDAAFGSPFLMLPGISNPLVSPNPLATPEPVDFCAGSNIAILKAPIGYATYQWYAPGTGMIAAPQGIQSSLMISNPIVASTYTALLTTPSGCMYTYTVAVAISTVNIAALMTNSSCVGGTSGSAIVYGTGSGSGYNYTWKNSSNLTIGTSSTVSNLAPGIYSVTITALGSPGCGSSTRTLSILSGTPPLIALLKPFCNNEAYLNTIGGSAHQWYNGTVAVPSGIGGTAPSYTILSPVNGSIYYLGYNSVFGCRDSIQYTLVSSPPGNLSVSGSTICAGATNGTANLYIIPAPSGPFGPNSYSVFSTGTTPAYSSSLFPTTAYQYSVSGLTAGGTYSVIAFDGFCKYAKSFSVTPHTLNYTVSPSTPTLCSGNNLQPYIAFTPSSTANQCTYSWLPASYFFNPLTQNPLLLLPSTPPGSVATLVFTVVVTPTLNACAFSKTMAVTVANPISPTLTSIPGLCSNSPGYTISVNPTNCTFVNNSAVSATGIISPSMASLGLNAFICSNGVGSCVATKIGTFVVNTLSMSVSPNRSISCGQTVTLTATGANTYSWSNSVTSPSNMVSPLTNQTFYVTGTNTTTTCSRTFSIQVLVTTTTNVHIVTDALPCSGQTSTFTALGASTYTWYNGATGSSISLIPQSYAIYSVSGTDQYGCSGTASISLSVYPNPTLTGVSDFSICPGITSTLQVFGANTYSLNNVPAYYTMTLNPMTSTVYTLTGATFGGCKASKIFIVEVTGCVGIENKFIETSKTLIYPNPTNGKVIIESLHHVHVSITDNSGRIIFQAELTEGINSLDLSPYESGVYFLTVKENLSLKNIKLIKVD